MEYIRMIMDTSIVMRIKTALDVHIKEYRKDMNAGLYQDSTEPITELSKLEPLLQKFDDVLPDYNGEYEIELLLSLDEHTLIKETLQWFSLQTMLRAMHMNNDMKIMALNESKILKHMLDVMSQQVA